ncbi:MAG: hypothetical protein ACFFAN_19815 [Promethearchaeota archaeon]
MSNNDKQLKPLIVDFGSSTTKIGWAGDDAPKIIAPSIYVDVRDYIFNSDIIDGLEDIFIKDNKNIEKHFFGNEALYYQNILKVHEFIKEKNYNILLKFFFSYYQQLDIEPKNQFKQPIIFITPFIVTDLEKAKLQQLFFKFFKFPLILFLPESQAILSTLQKTSGVIVNMSESNTYISTIFHGFTNIMARDIFPIAGNELTNNFLNLVLTEKGSGRNLYLNKILAKEIKEKTALCVLNPKLEEKKIKEGLKKYNQVINFPDGSSLEINSERFMITEPLFDPSLIHIDYISLDQAIANVIKTWDRENWEELLSSIILSGGGSLIPGLKERLEKALEKHFPEKLKNKLKVIAVEDRENMGWIGASILYSRDQLKKGWIQNPEFEPNI